MKVLAQLAESEAVEYTGADLVDLTGYKGPTVYPVVARLLAAGYVTRRDETRAQMRADSNYQGHRPRRFYKITAKGLAFLKG